MWACLASSSSCFVLLLWQLTCEEVDQSAFLLHAFNWLQAAPVAWGQCGGVAGAAGCGTGVWGAVGAVGCVGAVRSPQTRPSTGAARPRTARMPEDRTLLRININSGSFLEGRV